MEQLLNSKICTVPIFLTDNAPTNGYNFDK
jgi:hypothetical protein